MIGIIDYGVGNIQAFANIYKNLNMPFKIVKTISDFNNVDKLILPGVGSFDHVMRSLDQSGMRDILDELVLKKKIPVLGICVGLQMLANSSEEGVLPGLGWIDGKVKRFDTTLLNKKMPLPHMGWNSIHIEKANPLLSDLKDNSRFYFLHSFYIECNNKNNIIASSEYGENFDCIVNHENIYGIQPHPEKSHSNGITILKNFGEL